MDDLLSIFDNQFQDCGGIKLMNDEQLKLITWSDSNFDANIYKILEIFSRFAPKVQRFKENYSELLFWEGHRAIEKIHDLETSP